MSNDNVIDGAVAVPAWRERKNLLLGGAVGLAVLLVAGYFLLSGGSEETYEPIPSAASAARAGGSAAGAATPAASPTAAPTVVPALYEEDVFGDPFEAIYPPKPSAEPSAAAPAPAPAPAIVDVPVEVDTSGSAPVDESTASGSEQVSVRLVRVVDEDTVTVLVNGSKDASTYNAQTEFGGYFTLVSTRADENEATFTFGDGTPFTLREGQTKKFIV